MYIKKDKRFVINSIYFLLVLRLPSSYQKGVCDWRYPYCYLRVGNVPCIPAFTNYLEDCMSCTSDYNQDGDDDTAECSVGHSGILFVFRR